MLMKIFFIAAMLFSTAVNAQNKDFATKLMQLSGDEILDTAKEYLGRGISDTALICYNLIIKTPAKADDIKQQERIIRAYNNSSLIYLQMNDHLTAYEHLLKALSISEKYNIDAQISNIYLNMGNIYYRFDKFDIAKRYYKKALHAPTDSIRSFTIINNLVSAENDSGTRDSAFYYINKGWEIRKVLKNTDLRHMPYFLNNIAVRYYYDGMYDSSFYYLRKSLETVRNVIELGSPVDVYEQKYEAEALVLANIGKLFCDINMPDSALFYCKLSNAIAAKFDFFSIMSQNYFYLSEIEEQKGNIRNALEHYKKYGTLKDSIYNVTEFGKINQLQRLYEVSKTNREIEQHIIDKQIKDNTIYYQKIILYISLFVLLLISAGLVVVYLQKRNLNRAYHALFKKNIEIENLEKSSEKCPEIQPEIQAEIETEKAGTVTLTAEMQRELLQKVLTTMDDKSLVCDPEFTIDKLAAMIQSNRVYVSHVINACLKKNFRTLLNGYRIGEAKRILAEADIANYSIGYVAGKVGYKSQSTFFDTFKEVTGITPKFYLKSIQAHIAENQ